jgi:hypothetical protein
MGIAIFESVREALKAGYTLESPHPDSERFLHARIHTGAGWAKGTSPHVSRFTLARYHAA